MIARFVAAAAVWQCGVVPVVADEVPEAPFTLPAGFAATVLVTGVDNARSMALGTGGTLFIGTRRAGKLYAVSDPFTATPTVVTIAEGLDMPNGVAWFEGALYVAEARRILRYSNIESRLDAPGVGEVVVADLPYKNKLHAWKYIGFGPDRKLYISLGAPCNICEAPDLTVMLRMNPDGSGREVFARGIRNSVGFDWHPDTGELWFTDNGRDLLGDDSPPCELNRAVRPGMDFGFPYCHGADIADPELGGLGSCKDSAAPAQLLGPHVAPLGMRFYSGSMFPASYRGRVLIAEHGSWNRSKSSGRTGYRISLVTLQDNEAIAYEPFMTGFIDDDGQVIGRPVDLLVAPDGALLVSDDQRGIVYRVAYDNSD